MCAAAQTNIAEIRVIERQSHVITDNSIEYLMESLCMHNKGQSALSASHGRAAKARLHVYIPELSR